MLRNSAGALALAALAIPGLAHAQTRTKPTARGSQSTGLVARVNNQDITKAELVDLLVKTGARETVQKLVQKTVIEQEARKAGVTVTPAEVAVKVKEEKQRIVSGMMQQTGQPMTFAEITRKFGLTEGEIEWSVRIQLLGRKTFAKTLEKSVPSINDRIKVAHILLLTMPQPGPDGNKQPTPEEQKKKEDDAKAKLEGIVADIKAGKITFEDAAKKFSDDKSSGVDGGLLPWFSKSGMMVPEFENAAFALTKAGELSALVKTQYGYHVLKLVALGKDASAAEKKKFHDEELDKLVNAPNRFQAWLGGIVQKATVTLYPVTSIK